MVNNVVKPLSFFKQGEKFRYNGQIYTVSAQEKGMTEVFYGNRFWAWPQWNGKEEVKMEMIYGESK